MEKVDWKGMDDAILDAIADMSSKGYDEPTVRSVYYILGSMNLIPLTDGGYKRLDAKVVEMRKEGKIEWGFFAVKRGSSVEVGVTVPLPGGYGARVPYVTPKEWADFWVRNMARADETYQLPRWFNQEYLVEVWVEKDGLLGATASCVQDLEVTVRSPQGYGAWEFVNASIKQIINEMKRQHKTKVVIIYIGDLDPSGKDIPRFIEEDAIRHFIEQYGIEEFEFIDIGLNPEQVQKYNLPEVPEAPEVLQKIMRDPRRKWYIEEYGEIFTELDAFYALAFTDAKNLIRAAVEKYFDKDVYDKTRKLEKTHKKEVKETVIGYIETLGE